MSIQFYINPTERLVIKKCFFIPKDFISLSLNSKRCKWNFWEPKYIVTFIRKKL